MWKFVQQMYGGGPPLVQDLYFPTIPLSTRRLELPMVPVPNPLNLCFMISIVQSLLSNQHFAHFFFKKYWLSDIGCTMTLRRRWSVTQFWVELPSVQLTALPRSISKSWGTSSSLGSTRSNSTMLTSCSFIFATWSKKRLSSKHPANLLRLRRLSRPILTTSRKTDR